MKQNILIVQQDNFGGEQIAVKRLFDAYRQFLPGANCNHKLLAPFIESNAKFSFTGRLFRYFIWSRQKLYRLLRPNKYDFFVTSDYLLALAFYSLHIKNTKIIFLFHGLHSVVFNKFRDINFRQLTIKLLERLAWILSDAVVVPSDEAKQFLGLRNAFVVQNIVPDQFFVKKTLKNGKYFTVLYSGRITKNKGLENLIKSIDKISKSIPRFRLVVAYPKSCVDKQLYLELTTLIKNIGIKEYIQFVEDATEIKLIKLYSSADVLILPSQLEFAPLSVVEAMAAGTPVISTNVGNMGNLLMRLDQNLILKDSSTREIFEKILFFYKYSVNKKIKLHNQSIKIAKGFTSRIAIKSFKYVLNNI